MADGLKNNIEEIESITRLLQLNRIIKYNENVFREEEMLYADSTFFDVFDFEVMQGDPISMLRDPFSIVLTEETAIRYFGEQSVKNGSALGQQLETDDDSYQITGILKNFPSNCAVDLSSRKRHLPRTYWIKFSDHNWPLFHQIFFCLPCSA